MFKRGSKPFSFSLSDGSATLRDAILFFLAWIATRYGLDITPELQGALVVIIGTGMKALWKYINDTQRVSAL